MLGKQQIQGKYSIWQSTRQWPWVQANSIWISRVLFQVKGPLVRFIGLSWDESIHFVPGLVKEMRPGQVIKTETVHW